MTMSALGEPCVLLKLGEIVLKGKNRELFERRLHQQHPRRAQGARPQARRAQAARRHRDLPARGRHRRAGARPWPSASPTCPAWSGSTPPGGSPRTPTPCSRPAWSSSAEREEVKREGAFAVRSRRRDKRFPLRSNELDRLVGGAINDEYGLPVDLKNPELTLSIEVDKDEVFVFTGGLPGQGGLPVGSSGRALVLMSGGIDSPVAAYRMMRRGLHVDFLHFSGIPFTTLRVDLQGVRAGQEARPVPGRVAAVGGAVRQGPAVDPHLRPGPARGDRPAPAHAQDRRGGRPPHPRRRADHRRRARPGLLADPDQHHRPGPRGRAADPAPAGGLGQDRDHGRGPAHRHPGDLRAARRGLLQLLAPRRPRPGPRSRTSSRSRSGWTPRNSPSSSPTRSQEYARPPSRGRAGRAARLAQQRREVPHDLGQLAQSRRPAPAGRRRAPARAAGARR